MDMLHVIVYRSVSKFNTVFISILIKQYQVVIFRDSACYLEIAYRLYNV